ncbi:hypothetical protein F5144DRAFT_587929 [Chaetomium tenue]|uniref:Uncharacterized protein n=1 Tax=Chaetomium tenue TaxID=1854479 RepID=A0ACB7NUB0_9PEZI|nr:hypothetical protein F5144DRAFT_587929 [Chaetomium globosum]
MRGSRLWWWRRKRRFGGGRFRAGRRRWWWCCCFGAGRGFVWLRGLLSLLVVRWRFRRRGVVGRGGCRWGGVVWRRAFLAIAFLVLIGNGLWEKVRFCFPRRLGVRWRDAV